MIYRIKEHTIQFLRPGQRFDLDVLPAETVSAFLMAMEIFPLGTLSYLPVASVEEDTLWYDCRRAAFYSASIDQVLDRYAEQLNRAWRTEQKAKVRRLYWQHRSMAR
jgi:hypothetical protein